MSGSGETTEAANGGGEATDGASGSGEVTDNIPYGNSYLVTRLLQGKNLVTTL